MDKPVSTAPVRPEPEPDPAAPLLQISAPRPAERPRLPRRATLLDLTPLYIAIYIGVCVGIYSKYST